jgi:hypothetical protein
MKRDEILVVTESHYYSDFLIKYLGNDNYSPHSPSNNNLLCDGWFLLTQRLNRARFCKDWSASLQRLIIEEGHYLPPMPKLVINYGTASSKELPGGQLVDCTKFIKQSAIDTGYDDLEFNSEFNPIGKNCVFGKDVFGGEAYSIAKVCHHYKVPFISFKYIVSDDELEDDKKNGIYKFKKEILDKLLEN